MLANTGPVDDTVDGMGVITFADEVASGYFGLLSCVPLLSSSDVGRPDLKFRLL